MKQNFRLGKGYRLKNKQNQLHINYEMTRIVNI